MCLLRLDMYSTIPIYFIKPRIKAVSHFKTSSILWKNFEPLLISKCRGKKKKRYITSAERKEYQLDTKSFIKCYSLIGSTYFCSHVTYFLSFPVCLFCCCFSPPFSFLLLHFCCVSVEIFGVHNIWIKTCYTISCCTNTYHGDRLVHICNINRSWGNYNAGTFWHNLCETIL